MTVESMHQIQCPGCGGWLRLYQGASFTRTDMVEDRLRGSVFDTVEEAEYVQNLHWSSGKCANCENPNLTS